MYTLRTANPDDAGFIHTVVTTTMRDFAVATWGVWLDDEARKDAMEGARLGTVHIILVDGGKAGTLQFKWTESHLVLKQIYLLPNYQRRGIGTSILKDLISRSNESGFPITLAVLQVNSAREFYANLGFVVDRETRERVFMRYTPNDVSRAGLQTTGSMLKPRKHQMSGD